MATQHLTVSGVENPHQPQRAFPHGTFRAIDAACATVVADGAPGVAASVVVCGEIVHSFAAGHLCSHSAAQAPTTAADVSQALEREDNAVDADTVFLTASISKTVMAIVCMQAVERGDIGLDADLREVARTAAATGANSAAAAAIAAAARNYNGFPDSPITARHLLTHTSGLRDDEQSLEEGSVFRVEGHDHPLALWEYVAQRLAPTGADYSLGIWTKTAPPGAAKYGYSNAGFALLGAALELATRTPLTRLVKERVFDPLGMTRSTFTLAEALVIAHGNIARPHRKMNPIDHYGVAEWPAAQLRSSASDLGRLLCALTAPDGPTPLLQRDSVQTMLPLDFCSGLAWWGKDAIYSSKTPGLWEHGGMMDGVRTHIWLMPEACAGAVFLSNSTEEYDVVEAAVLALLSSWRVIHSSR